MTPFSWGMSPKSIRCREGSGDAVSWWSQGSTGNMDVSGSTSRSAQCPGGGQLWGHLSTDAGEGLVCLEFIQQIIEPKLFYQTCITKQHPGAWQTNDRKPVRPSEHFTETHREENKTDLGSRRVKSIGGWITDPLIFNKDLVEVFLLFCRETTHVLQCKGDEEPEQKPYRQGSKRGHQKFHSED